MAMNKIELVIFDCDGVLIDSEVISGKVLIELLAALGVDIDFAYVQKNFIGRSFQKVAAEIGQRFGLNLPNGFEAEYRTKLLQAFETDLKPTNGIIQLLAGLQVKKCVATSSSPERSSRSLDITQLKGFFTDDIFTASLVENGKPAPDLFLFAAAQMGVEPAHCLVIEDSLPGIKAAQNAQMPVWHYCGGSHLQGVDLMLNAAEKPDRVFNHWTEFSALLPEIFVK